MKKSLTIKASGVAMAVAAAGMLSGCQSNDSSASGSAAAKATQVEMAHCYGVNACGGHNDCKTANNACKGHGSCKGHGFVSMPTKACKDVGGKLQDDHRGEASSADMSKCFGVNVCGGHNDCKTAKNACGGHASCKGTGFVSMPAKACKDIGGKLG